MRWIQMFEEGSTEQKDLLGGKGANLAEMTRMGLPVPPGFTITTEACNAYYDEGGQLPHGLLDEVHDSLSKVEEKHGKKLGDASDPLLLSVRSGAKFSMPGMMDTILDLGLNDETVKGFAQRTEDERFAYDGYRRLLELYGRIVMGVAAEKFEDAREPILERAGVQDPAELDADGAREITSTYHKVIADETGTPFPSDPQEQLKGAIEAVFRSWNGRRAKDYRAMEGISDDLGTAVNVQVMVFGNAGEDSGTGVAFTRDPATGDPNHYGDFLVNAQGEDVVAGIRHTEPLSALGDKFPEVHTQLNEMMDQLEEHYQDMNDIEFTIEKGQLYLLQTRIGKRSAAAALRMAVDMEREGLIDKRTAVSRFSPDQLERLLHPRFDSDADYEVLATGLNASPGAAAGHVAFTADDAAARAEEGEKIILVRPETSPEDLHGMIAAEGILTSRGGLVSHAAVVARGIGTPAICGAADLDISIKERKFTVGDTVVNDGDYISIDGGTGEIVVGEVPVVVPEATDELETILGWADELRRLDVHANADTPEDAQRAREFGATGIGLCRTEHMFLGDRLPIVQKLILTEDEAEEQEALEELHQVQLKDFEEILEAMDGYDVTVRLLDPPLHEFLPSLEELLIAEAKDELDDEGQVLLAAARAWSEENPMLGVRGVRLGVLRPRIYRMQVQSLAEAAIRRVEAGGDPRPEIMIPLVTGRKELAHALKDAKEVIAEVEEKTGKQVPHKLGAMIETPRAALRANEMAEIADFFSFGTNDLTQLTFGFSRDDVEGRMMPVYLEENILPYSPFRTIDFDGVGELVTIAVERARSTKENIILGICGEHGGDPESVHFCHGAGLDYVSCSPFRVQVARLAAAHAAMEDVQDTTI